MSTGPTVPTVTSERPGSRGLTVLCARPDGQDEAIGPPVSPVLAAVARYTDAVHFVGRFPSRDIDPLLTPGRIVVIGELSHLAAVVQRLLRRGLLGAPDSDPAPDLSVGYVPMRPDELSHRRGLPVGPGAVELACDGTARPIPLLRDDAGGVLLGIGQVQNPDATVYVDEHRVLAGPADRLVVRPGDEGGVAVTVERARRFGLPPRRATTAGRAVSIGFRQPSTVNSDGVDRPRPAARWTWYAHVHPLPLARP